MDYLKKKTVSIFFRVIDSEQPTKQRKNFDWVSYWDYNKVNEWMDSLVAQYPQHVTHINYGKSFQNRDLRGVKVNIGGGSKNSVVFEATMHAREWISTATTTWMLNELLTSTDPETQELARTYEWYVFPITNPDGYSYTWTNDRMWRKTRRPNNLLCVGTDPNRNWDSHHNERGASTNPCSDTYAGPAPFSEPETKALSDYVASIPRLSVYLCYHAYGQMLMSPYGWTTGLPPNYQTLYEVGAKGVEALTAKFGTRYALGSIANVICKVLNVSLTNSHLTFFSIVISDMVSGSSVDWVNEKLGTNISYAYEFRDEGRFGFSLPVNQIIDNSIEIFASVNAILKEGRARGIA